MRKLTIKDFKTGKVGKLVYKTFLGKKCEICIEPGFKCIDIAVYDLEKSLLEPKITISSPAVGFDADIVNRIIEYVKQIDKTVNNFYRKWETK